MQAHIGCVVENCVRCAGWDQRRHNHELFGDPQFDKCRKLSSLRVNHQRLASLLFEFCDPWMFGGIGPSPYFTEPCGWIRYEKYTHQASRVGERVLLFVTPKLDLLHYHTCGNRVLSAKYGAPYRIPIDLSTFTNGELQTHLFSDLLQKQWSEFRTRAKEAMTNKALRLGQELQMEVRIVFHIGYDSFTTRGFHHQFLDHDRGLQETNHSATEHDFSDLTSIYHLPLLPQRRVPFDFKKCYYLNLRKMSMNQTNRLPWENKKTTLAKLRRPMCINRPSRWVNQILLDTSFEAKFFKFTSKVDFGGLEPYVSPRGSFETHKWIQYVNDGYQAHHILFLVSPKWSSATSTFWPRRTFLFGRRDKFWRNLWDTFRKRAREALVGVCSEIEQFLQINVRVFIRIGPAMENVNLRTSTYTHPIYRPLTHEYLFSKKYTRAKTEVDHSKIKLV